MVITANVRFFGDALLQIGCNGGGPHYSCHNLGNKNNYLLNRRGSDFCKSLFGKGGSYNRRSMKIVYFNGTSIFDQHTIVKWPFIYISSLFLNMHNFSKWIVENYILTSTYIYYVGQKSARYFYTWIEMKSNEKKTITYVVTILILSTFE